MIIPGQAMLVSETAYKEGEPAAPDSITAILYRIVSGSRSASGVTVTVSTTANTGEYTFAWTNDAGWSRADDLELKAIPVIDGKSYPMVVWRSHGHVDAVMRGTNGAALPGDVSPTIDFQPTINPTPVTVNPTTLDPAAVAAIQDGLAMQVSLDSVVAVTAKLGVMIEDDGAGGWTYTVSALGNVPIPVLTGPNQLTVAVSSRDDGQPIEAARVRVYRAGQSQTEHTGEDGRFAFAVDSATWAIAVKAAGFESKIVSLAINGDHVEPVALTPSTGAGNPNPDLCDVTVDVRTQYGKPVAGACVHAYVVKSPTLAGDALLVSDSTGNPTNASGRAAFELYRGQTYHLEVTHGGVTWRLTVTVPATGSYHATADV